MELDPSFQEPPSLHTEVTCQATSSLNSPRFMSLCGIYRYTAFYTYVFSYSQVSSKRAGVSRFHSPPDCAKKLAWQKWSIQKYSSEKDVKKKSEKKIQGEKDVKLRQASVGNGSVPGTLPGLGYAYLPLLIMHLASQLCFLYMLCTPPSFNNVVSILKTPTWNGWNTFFLP